MTPRRARAPRTNTAGAIAALLIVAVALCPNRAGAAAATETTTQSAGELRSLLEIPQNGTACLEGFVPDDGSIETGWGWVPSVVDGRYVQRFTLAEIAPSRLIDRVCLCWIRTRDDSTLDFNLELYADVDGRPADSPVWSRSLEVQGVPEGVPGGFSCFETAPLVVDEQVFYLGASWDPSADQFFFVCADTSPETEAREVFFRDDRSDGWASVFETSDPLFADHRALGLRLEPGTALVDVPVDPRALAVLAALVALAGGILLSRSQHGP